MWFFKKCGPTSKKNLRIPWIPHISIDFCRDFMIFLIFSREKLHFHLENDPIYPHQDHIFWPHFFHIKKKVRPHQLSTSMGGSTLPVRGSSGEQIRNSALIGRLLPSTRLIDRQNLGLLSDCSCERPCHACWSLSWRSWTKILHAEPLEQCKVGLELSLPL